MCVYYGAPGPIVNAASIICHFRDPPPRCFRGCPPLMVYDNATTVIVLMVRRIRGMLPGTDSAQVGKPTSTV
jgi:hypothetical protein